MKVTLWILLPLQRSTVIERLYLFIFAGGTQKEREAQVRQLTLEAESE
jgi:hypothetical protein